MEKTYAAVRIVQLLGAQPFYLLRAPASELLQWADIPRKKLDFMAGYQRDLSDRHSGITDFLKLSPRNILPGAIIVAIDAASVTATSVPGTADGTFQVTVSVPESDFNTRLLRIRDGFLHRLSPEEKQSISNTQQQQLAPEDTDEGVEPPSYLAILAAELNMAVSDWQRLTPDRQKAVSEYVNGVSKPGLIIDGQHRVIAAKNVNTYDVQLPIVLLPGLSMSEQVFHFYVLNNTARPLKPTQLRATVSTSLSNGEIDELWKRMDQAGVNPEEARWTHIVNTDDSSPFRGLVDFGLGERGAFIPENVAHQLVRAFLKMGKRHSLLWKTVQSWNVDDADYSYRMKMFFVLWSAIRDKYRTAWDNGVARREAQLFMKASMLTLQEFLLDSLVQEMPRRASKNIASPLVDADEFRTEVSASLFFLPEEFFQEEWTTKGLDTHEGREQLRSWMQQAINQQGKYILKIPLFKK